MKKQIVKDSQNVYIKNQENNSKNGYINNKIIIKFFFDFMIIIKKVKLLTLTFLSNYYLAYSITLISLIRFTFTSQG